MGSDVGGSCQLTVLTFQMPAAVARSDVGSGVSATHEGGGEGLITENKVVSDVVC